MGHENGMGLETGSKGQPAKRWPKSSLQVVLFIWDQIFSYGRSSSCCWITGLNANSGISYNAEAVMSFKVRPNYVSNYGKINTPPQIEYIPLIQHHYYGGERTYRLPVSDPDGDILKCKWAANYTQGGGVWTNRLGTLHEVRVCIFYWYLKMIQPHLLGSMRDIDFGLWFLNVNTLTLIHMGCFPLPLEVFLAVFFKDINYVPQTYLIFTNYLFATFWWKNFQTIELTGHVTCPYLEASSKQNIVFNDFNGKVWSYYEVLYTKWISKRRALIWYRNFWNLMTSAFLDDDVIIATILG